MLQAVEGEVIGIDGMNSCCKHVKYILEYIDIIDKIEHK